MADYPYRIMRKYLIFCFIILCWIVTGVLTLIALFAQLFYFNGIENIIDYLFKNYRNTLYFCNFLIIT